MSLKLGENFMKRSFLIILASLFFLVNLNALNIYAEENKAQKSKDNQEVKEVKDNKDAKINKPSSEQIINVLKEGNERFASGKSKHSNIDNARIAFASKEDQAKHALATVLSCSDSKVPVEHIFDVGIMDVFVIRVAGNTCGLSEIGSIEYGISQANTPVLIVMGHTDCEVIKKALYTSPKNKAHFSENVKGIIDKIDPAVKKAVKSVPKDAKDNIIIGETVKQNVWQSIEAIFAKSPEIRKLFKTGKIKIVGAIYDVSTGKVNWLETAKIDEIAKKYKK